MTPEPRTALATGLALAVAGAAGPRAAAVSFAGSLAFAGLLRERPGPLVLRLLPLALGFSGLLLVAPFAPGRTLELALRGLALSVALAVTAGAVPWTAAVGLIERLRAPTAAVVFLAVLARDLAVARERTGIAVKALVLRGGFASWRGATRGATVLLLGLLPDALDRADRTADALALRGFRGKLPRPPAHRLRPTELPFLAVALAAAIAALLELAR